VDIESATLTHVDWFNDRHLDGKITKDATAPAPTLLKLTSQPTSRRSGESASRTTSKRHRLPEYPQFGAVSSGGQNTRTSTWQRMPGTRAKRALAETSGHERPSASAT